MDLRQYQFRTLDEVWSSLQVQLNVLMVAPCSAGKTILFSKIIQRLLRENPAFRCLILVDREILVTQSADKLRGVAPELALSIGIVCASVASAKEVHHPVTIASRQSLIGQLDRFPPVNLIILDEAHLVACPTDENPSPDQYGKILSALRGYNSQMRIVGCTASPYRLGTGYIYGSRNKSGSRPYWTKVDSAITTVELLAGGYIAPLVGRVKLDGEILNDLAHVSMQGGEFNVGQLSDIMCKTIHISSCVEAWQQYASDRKKTLVFCATIEHAERVAEAFNLAGISSCAIHSKLTAIDNMVRMEALNRGTMRVFTSVAKLTTGMDVVDIDCIVMARPTKSTALYQQCIGRGQRLADGKTDCLVIDLVGATKEFGVDMDNLRMNIPYGSGNGEAPVKICPGEHENGTVCGQAVHASLKYCPHCSFEFPSTEQIEAAVGTLKKIEFNRVEIAEPVEYGVTHVSYQSHVSKNSGKELIKVSYECGVYSHFSEYLCLPPDYSGYAVEKARSWWEDRSDEPFPDTCEEFLFLKEELAEPVKITVVKDGKFDRITKYTFAETDYSMDEMKFEDFSTGDKVPF